MLCTVYAVIMSSVHITSHYNTTFYIVTYAVCCYAYHGVHMDESCSDNAQLTCQYDEQTHLVLILFLTIIDVMGLDMLQHVILFQTTVQAQQTGKPTPEFVLVC